ncbi:MAG: response regulator transcription factor [Brevundimonas sp.]|jgi:DNA-binding LytR/AlgR family response regulator|uniref:LytR/AlgR family response regulator transcription factor n=1 Tax=Brevundimonas sp. TaxID=1871086 RepID=UPI0017EA7BED|nr:LytTR family DNA-binding domain-containing protein [Brevundimonas sp.]MBA4803361.1 response regulator transcription factor [Brevundimonas sp.]
MTPLRVLLVDDEPLALARLEVGFREIADTVIVGVARNGDEAISRIESLRPDVVILDVKMPLRDGLEVARSLGESDAPEVVFVTAFEQFAPDAFEIEAADYLLKPIRFERLRIAVERARRRRAARESGARIEELENVVEALRADARGKVEPGAAYESELWIPTSHGAVRVAASSIIWIEAARDYVILHTAARSLILRETMARMEERLDPALVLRVHRSAFVNPAAVTGIQRLGKGQFAVILSDGQTVTVGPNYSQAVLAVLSARGRR